MSRYSSLVLLALLAPYQSEANNTVWSDVELLQEHLRQQRSLQQQEAEDPGLLCRGAIEVFNALAPPNDDRDCSCNLWNGSLECSYQSVECGDKILPSMEVVFDLGILASKIRICQSFAEKEFEPVCINADLDGMKYGTCNGATMGFGPSDTKKCSCTVCEGGTTMDIDCSEKHPLAKTNGCQRVFFQDSCLDFLATQDADNTSDVETVPELVDSDNATSLAEGPAEVAVVIESILVQAEADNENNTPVQTDTEWEPETVLQQILSNSLIGIQSMISSRLQRTFTQRVSSTGTPSQRAGAWLREDPNYGNYDSSKLIQRYALASLYYSTTEYETEWSSADNWLSTAEDECNWFSVSSDICTESGQLEMLDLAENGLYGTISPDIGFLRTVKYFYLCGNYLTGTIPTEVGKLTNMIDFDIRESELNGTIPTEIGLLTHLEALSLQENDLTGTIPSELGLLTNVYAMELHQNMLSGTVPTELCDLIANYNVLLFLDCDEYGVECDCGCECI